jgi:hypothetical protein
VLKLLDKHYWQSVNLNFHDEGPVTPGSKTRRFAVISRHSQALLGYVKWFNRWRQYTFQPLNAVFNDGCLEEVADFVRRATKAHRSKTAIEVPEPE